MKPLIVVITAITIISRAYAGPDLACEAILEPSGDYVLADTAVTPELQITNLGDQGASNFFVKLIIVDPWLTGDTVYLDSVHVGYIDASPEPKEVEFAPWTPEGYCAKLADGGSFVEYELSGIACLGTDADHSNDTLRKISTCLLAHDVGVTDIVAEPPPTYPPDCYEIGTEVVFTVTVENFGFNQETKIPVKLEVVDKTADPDTLVYLNIQLVEEIGWRGDTEKPYTAEVAFPRWVVPSYNWFTKTSKTEMSGDLCPDDDIGPIVNINPSSQHSPCDGVEEANAESLEFELDVSDFSLIRFTLPLPSWVRLDVYDASGGFVRNLYNDPCQAGSHSLSWNGRDSRGTMVSSGAYFIKMQTGTFTASSKLIVIK